MKAIVLEEAGGIEQLKIKEIPQPVAGVGEVLIKVKAFSINPVDIKTRKGGAFFNTLKETGQAILGWDVAGEVVALGEGVEKFELEDYVFGMVNFPGAGNAYAEYVAAPAAHLADQPDLISDEEAAASTLAALTAWQVLLQQAKVQPGERVLIHAAAGGVGHFAVQIAKYVGAFVIGTGSYANYDFIKELGADETIDYTDEPFEDQVKDVDVVFDTVGGENPLRSLKTLKPGGRMVVIAGGLTDEVKKLAQEMNVTASAYLVQSNGDDMEQIAELLEAGTIKPHVSQVFGFNDIAAAHQQIETGRTRGKIVVVV